MAVLLKWEKDWADEFDMTGFRVLSDKIWGAFQIAVEKMEYPQDMYFGTNEEYVFENASAIMSGIKTLEINDEDIKVLKKLFKPGWNSAAISFGWDPIEQVLESLSEEDYIKLVGDEQY